MPQSILQGKGFYRFTVLAFLEFEIRMHNTKRHTTREMSLNIRRHQKKSSTVTGQKSRLEKHALN